jgi:DNA-binding CsgD family transcriptional regulator
MLDAISPRVTGEAERIVLLTQRQMSALRLSLCGLNSKQIGRLLKVSNHTIDKDAERAMRIVGATSRFDAAQIVMRHFIGPYERFVYEAHPLVAQAKFGPVEAVGDEIDPVAEQVAEAPAFYVPPPATLSFPAQLKIWFRPENFRPSVRGFLMVPLAALIVLAVVFTLIAAFERGSQWFAGN